MKDDIITRLKLETATRALKKQGKSVRDIAKILSQKHNVPISASAVFRFLQKDSLKQAEQARPKIMKINLNPRHRETSQRPFTIWNY